MPRILIVKLGAIGDVLMTIPAAHALHMQGNTIDWVCGRTVAPVLALYPWINAIPVDESALFPPGPNSLAPIAALWRTLAGRHYALVATLYYDARYRVLTLPVRATRRIALSHTDRNLRLLPGRHQPSEWHRILLGLSDDHRETSIAPVAPATLPDAPLPTRTARRRIAIVPGGSANILRQQTLRRWPLPHYVAVVSALLARGDEVVLLGGPTDAWVREAFAAHASDPALHASDSALYDQLFDRIGQLTLAQTITACETSDLVLSHDTGPLHLAGLSRARILALFGPTDAAVFLPRRPGVRALLAPEPMACRPCYDGRDFAPCTFNACMAHITPSTVLREIDALLTERA